MNTKIIRASLLSILTVAASMATPLVADDSAVSVDFKVSNPCAAITNDMVIANITVDRPYYDIYWTVNCATDPDFFFAGSCHSASAGAGTYTIIASTPSAEPVELNLGNVYAFSFQTCEFGWDAYTTVATFEVTGTGAEAEQFSDIQLLDIGCQPNALGEYPYQTQYTITFSDAVKEVKAFAPSGMDGTQDYPVRQADDEGITWTVDCSASANEEGSFELHIQARDAVTGLRLKGSYNLDHSFIYTIKCSGTAPTPDDRPSDDPDDNPIDPEGVELHEGMNELQPYTAVTAYFVAQTDCKVLIEAEDQYLVTYNGQTYTFDYIPTNWPSNVCEVDNVKAGSLVVIKSDFVMNPLVRITTLESGIASPIEVHNVSPAEGTSDFWAKNGQLDVTFNKLVALSGAQLVAGETAVSLEILHVSSAVSIEIGSTLNTLLEDGRLSTGDNFEVVISGLCEASNKDNLYNGTGELRLSFVAPEPQYRLVRTTVADHELYTSGLNPYTFLSYYAPDGEDGLFVLEFEHEVGSVDGALLQMGNRDLDAEGKYHESALPVSVEGNRVMVDARGVLRTLSILFPAVVEADTEPGETINEGLGDFDREHLTLRVSNVIDTNGNAFHADQAGNLGSYSFYMSYRELVENINLDGDNKLAGDEVIAGETIRLWLSSSDVTFEGLQVTYLAELEEEESYEPRTVLQPDYITEADPYQGVIIEFEMPFMPDVAVGQNVHVALYNAVTTDGMPHDLGIDFKAGQEAVVGAIDHLHNDTSASHAWTLTGIRISPSADVPAGTPCIVGHKILIRK